MKDSRIVRYCYSLCLYLAAPFILLRLWWRGRKAPDYRKRVAERFALANLANFQGCIWIHAVSLGEVIVATPIIKALLAEFSQHKLLVTTSTPTGSAQLKKQFANQVFHVYAPYDFPDAVARFLNTTKPKLAIFIETELWPNVLAACKKRAIPTMLANARLSAKSAAGYQKVSLLSKPMLGALSIIAAQAEADGQRFQALGYPADRLTITGNIKYDLTPADAQIQAGLKLRQQLGANRPVWIASSTHQGEDELVLEAFKILKRQKPEALLMLVPRHPERFEPVFQLCQQQGFSVTRRSLATKSDIDSDVYLGDTFGELVLMYAASDVAFVGGSLIPRGGHNVLEAIATNSAVITGPHTFNFAQIIKQLRHKNAITVVDNAEQLADAVTELLSDDNKRQQQQSQAQTVLKANTGALAHHLELITSLLSTDNAL